MKTILQMRINQTEKEIWVKEAQRANIDHDTADFEPTQTSII